ncbi:MAG: ATP-binding cassette domain-containing protein, partial [Pseudomonadota bacterium]
MSQPAPPEVEPPDVEIVGLSKRFGPVTALDTVSERFQPGCFHALLGENGAGKSTLVKCLMGFYRADAGQIVITGRERRIEGPQD